MEGCGTKGGGIGNSRGVDASGLFYIGFAARYFISFIATIFGSDAIDQENGMLYGIVTHTTRL